MNIFIKYVKKIIKVPLKITIFILVLECNSLLYVIEEKEINED